MCNGRLHSIHASGISLGLSHQLHRSENIPCLFFENIPIFFGIIALEFDIVFLMI